MASVTTNPFSSLMHQWQTMPGARFSTWTSVGLFFSDFVSRGYIPQKIGRHHLIHRLNSLSPEFLAWASSLYGESVMQDAVKNPRAIWIQGHCHELVHKVIAATAFYLTSHLSSIQSLRCLTPQSTRIAQITTPIFEKIAHSQLLSAAHPLSRLHIIDLMPVIVKILHFLLDYASVNRKAQNPTLESCRAAVASLGTYLEALWYVRLALIAIASGGGATPLFLLSMGSVFLGPLIQMGMFHLLPYFVTEAVQSQLSYAPGAGMALAKAQTVLQKFHPTSDLHPLQTAFQSVQVFNFRPETFSPEPGAQNHLEALKTHINQFLVSINTKGELLPEEAAHLKTVIGPKFQEYAEKQLFNSLLDKSRIVNMTASQENLLRQIYGTGGYAAEFSTSQARANLESLRFSLILLDSQLRRLQAIQGLSEQQQKEFQECLVVLAARDLCSFNRDALDSLLLTGIEQLEGFKTLSQQYNDFHGMPYKARQGLYKEFAFRHPFFQPIKNLLLAFNLTASTHPEISEIVNELNKFLPGMRTLDTTEAKLWQTRQQFQREMTPFHRRLQGKYPSSFEEIERFIVSSQQAPAAP